MSPFSKNLQRFLVFFFSALSVVLVVLGVIRIKKPVSLAEAPAPTPAAPPEASASPSASASSITVKGNAYQTPWGSAVASITVKNGKVIAASMPSIPNSPPSVYAEPYLVDQAIKAGSANIQGVSGATYTSIAFKSSLESALAKAKTQGQTVTAVTAPTTAVGATAKPSVPRKYRRDDDEWDD